MFVGSERVRPTSPFVFSWPDDVVVIEWLHPHTVAHITKRAQEGYRIVFLSNREQTETMQLRYTLVDQTLALASSLKFPYLALYATKGLEKPGANLTVRPVVADFRTMAMPANGLYDVYCSLYSFDIEPDRTQSFVASSTTGPGHTFATKIGLPFLDVISLTPE